VPPPSWTGGPTRGLLCPRIKQCRRVATRYDKLSANYLAFVQLASISRNSRVPLIGAVDVGLVRADGAYGASGGNRILGGPVATIPG